MGLGAYRFSLEWSRIEPAEGEFSLAALDHYRRIRAGCHRAGHRPGGDLPPLHHSSWLAGWGGFKVPEALMAGARVVERSGADLGDLIGWGCTINEPNVIGAMGYTVGNHPPGVKDDLGRHLAVNKAMVRAHRLAVDALRPGPGDYPGRASPFPWRRSWPTREGRHPDMAEDILGGHLPPGHRGRRLRRRPGLHPDALRSRGSRAPMTRRWPRPQMGTENWPGAVAHCARRTAAFTGLPVAGHRERDRHRGRHRANPLSRLRAARRPPLRHPGCRCPRLLRVEPPQEFRMEHGVWPETRSPRGVPDYVRANGQVGSAGGSGSAAWTIPAPPTPGGERRRPG